MKKESSNLQSIQIKEDTFVNPISKYTQEGIW